MALELLNLKRSALAAVEVSLANAAEGHNSGKFPTAAARKQVAALVRRKLALIEEIAAAS